MCEEVFDTSGIFYGSLFDQLVTRLKKEEKRKKKQTKKTNLSLCSEQRGFF